MAFQPKFLAQLNSKYSAIDKKAFAQKMLQGGVEAGKAIVNILSATGIAGFKFNVPQTEMVKFESDITDHFIETNAPVQDHIAQKPVVITLTGLVGDYFYSVHQLEDMVANIVTTLKIIQAYLPNISKQVQEAKYQKARETFGASNKLSLKDYYGIYRNEFNDIDVFALMQSLYKFKSPQTRAFLFFEALWKKRALFTVETTWRRYDNMAIQSITARRDNNADITEFTITLKQISLTQTLVESVRDYQGRLAQQKAEITNKGLSEGTLMSLDDVYSGAIG